MKVKSNTEIAYPKGENSIFDLHQVIICLENQFVVFLRVAFLHRLYYIVSLLPSGQYSFCLTEHSDKLELGYKQFMWDIYGDNILFTDGKYCTV